jgi:hypothetical protein
LTNHKVHPIPYLRNLPPSVNLLAFNCLMSRSVFDPFREKYTQRRASGGQAVVIISPGSNFPFLYSRDVKEQHLLSLPACNV